MIKTNDRTELQIFNRAAKIHRGWSKLTVTQEAFALRWLELAKERLADKLTSFHCSRHEALCLADRVLGYSELHKRRIWKDGEKSLRTQE